MRWRSAATRRSPEHRPGPAPGFPRRRLCADVEPQPGGGFARLERYQRIIAEASDPTFRRTPRAIESASRCMAIACRRHRRVPNARWPTWWTWSAGSPAGRWTRWRWNCPARPREPLAPMSSCSARRCAFTPREFALVFSRVDLETLPSAKRGAGPVARSLRRRIPGAFGTSRITHLTRQTLCRLLPQGTQARTGGPGAAPVAAAPCNGASRKKAPATSNCSTTRAGIWPNSISSSPA